MASGRGKPLTRWPSLLHSFRCVLGGRIVNPDTFSLTHPRKSSRPPLLIASGFDIGVWERNSLMV